MRNQRIEIKLELKRMKRWVTQNHDAFSDDEILKLEIFFDKTIDENDEMEEQSKSFTKKFESSDESLYMPHETNLSNMADNSLEIGNEEMIS